MVDTVTTSETTLKVLVAAGLSDIVVLPKTDLYSSRESSYYSLSARLKPWALLLPRTPEEAAASFRAVVGVPGLQFAIRGGGYNYNPGASNIADGVTIDLHHLKAVTYDEKTQIASVQAGANWGEAYTALQNHGRAITGGRVADIGVAGFLLGGGLSLTNTQTGFGCDSVVRYEMVTATGELIEVDKQSHPDLFLALKGGGNNLGLVTRFDMATFQSPKMWGGMGVYAPKDVAAIFKIFETYLKHMPQRPGLVLMPLWTVGLQPNDMVAVIASQIGNEMDEEVFGDLVRLQAGMGEYKKDMTLQDLSQLWPTQPAKLLSWRSVGIKADSNLVRDAYDLTIQLKKDVDALGIEGDFVIMVEASPLSQSTIKESLARGGNLFNLPDTSPQDRTIPHDAIVLLVMCESSTKELHKAAKPLLVKCVDTLGKKSEETGVKIPWLYMNYSDGSQDVLGSYGKKALELLKSVSERYDPDGVFQKRVKGGFKIRRE